MLFHRNRLGPPTWDHRSPVTGKVSRLPVKRWPDLFAIEAYSFPAGGVQSRWFELVLPLAGVAAVEENPKYINLRLSRASELPITEKQCPSHVEGYWRRTNPHDLVEERRSTGHPTRRSGASAHAEFIHVHPDRCLAGACNPWLLPSSCALERVGVW